MTGGRRCMEGFIPLDEIEFHFIFNPYKIYKIYHPLYLITKRHFLIVSSIYLASHLFIEWMLMLEVNKELDYLVLPEEHFNWTLYIDKYTNSSINHLIDYSNHNYNYNNFTYNVDKLTPLPHSNRNFHFPYVVSLNSDNRLELEVFFFTENVFMQKLLFNQL
ncbi:hypothetical protein TRFO_22506 [Tritrichomonas foetus]|uniref:Uncharacterized protein n=1 Tax=Tritrichomonas foetus TaxID=1144522 RepID=A0A1J4KC95_9EUKA|nr:hypothetical protein TRFO_22506 [Tritrichomonas foetus]|eukprot:OHT08843.1 hypothetical protein TRFO_22506 [Tritrichomonas foetus]